MLKFKEASFFSLLFLIWSGFSAHNSSVASEPSESSQLRALIIGEVFASSEIRANLSMLCNEIGGRVSGTAPGDQAQDFVLQKLSDYGLDYVRLESFGLLGWERVSARASAVSPKEKELSGIALAYTPTTLPGGVTAPVIDVGTGHPREFEQLGEEIRGKIALLRVGTLPGERWLHRSEKMTHCIGYGAAGMLLRTNVTGDLPRTGTCQYGKLSTIPGMGISKEDGDWLVWMLEKGEDVVVNIHMKNRVGQAQAANVIGEIRGREKPDELVIVGAHLDSWDLGTGAVDNGTGSAVVLEAARVLAKCGERPKRTIRFILFMGEEFGLVGSKTYVALHHKELDRIIMMMNLDMVGRPYGYRVHGHEEAIPFLTSLAQSMKGLGMDPEKVSSRVGIFGDYEPFMIQGVPTMTIRSKLEDDVGRYYHTAGDTFDKLNFQSLNECAAIVAVTLMEMANAEEKIGTRMPQERVKKMLIEHNLKEPLEHQGNWPFDEAHE